MIYSMSTRRTSCRLCENKELILVLPIKATPIADAFVTADKLNIAQPLIPLDLYQCQACGHVQNIDIVNPNLLFRDYIFQTSSSAGLVNHFSQYAADIINQFDVQPNSLVVEIGSNDGTLLKFFNLKGMQVIGVDPALEIAKQATASGIPTIPDFFTTTLGNDIKSQHGLAKLIVANNVYAHCDQLADMTDAIESLLDDDGVFVFEVSYLMDIIDNFLFDTVYHEHLSYHAIEPFQKFFKRHGLHLFDVKRIHTKGGSIRGFVQRISGKRPEQPIINEMILEEQRRGLNKPEIFREYENAILERKKAVQEFVDTAISNNKTIACYGASTTVITLMYHFELEDKIKYLIDDNQKKHGMYSPGKHLEVKPSSILYSANKPDIVLVLAWQYANAIYGKNEEFVKNGGQFAIPLPSFKLIREAIVA